MHRGAVEWRLRVHEMGALGTPQLGPKGITLVLLPPSVVFGFSWAQKSP